MRMVYTIDAPRMSSATGVYSDTITPPSLIGAIFWTIDSSRVLSFGGFMRLISMSLMGCSGEYWIIEIVFVEVRRISSYATKMPRTPKIGFIYRNIYNASDITTIVPNRLSMNGVRTVGVDGWKTKYTTKSTNKITSKGDALNPIII